MSGKKSALLVIAILILFVSACASQPVPPTPTATATQAPTVTPPPARPPASEAEVPRVPVKEAKAALENRTAIVVDVRSPAAFQASHVAGALSIPLADIEANPAGLKLDKNQWVITYCT